MTNERPFLTARWRFLAMLNYEVQASSLAPFVPPGTQLDAWHGKTYLSLVGFLFLGTRLRGIPVPWHQRFAEVNLRFYVVRSHATGNRRGVVFIKEIVSRRGVTAVARSLYHENYVTLPMRHHVNLGPDDVTPRGLVSYGWRLGGKWNQLSIRVEGPSLPLQPGTHEEFIAEHYWGYTRRRDGGTTEYRVEHPAWRIWPAINASLQCDVAALYGPQLAPLLRETPTSAFVADGSAVAVHRGTRIADAPTD